MCKMKLFFQMISLLTICVRLFLIKKIFFKSVKCGLTDLIFIIGHITETKNLWIFWYLIFILTVGKIMIRKSTDNKYKKDMGNYVYLIRYLLHLNKVK